MHAVCLNIEKAGGSTSINEVSSNYDAVVPEGMLIIPAELYAVSSNPHAYVMRTSGCRVYYFKR